MGNKNKVTYLIKIEKIKNIKAKNSLFLDKRKKEKSTKNIITISLCPLTNVSITTKGFKANKASDNIFLDNFQIINVVPA